jgi:hypothetical protein
MEWVYIYLTLVRTFPSSVWEKTTTRQSRNANSLMRVETKTHSGASHVTGSMRGNDGLCERS